MAYLVRLTHRAQKDSENLVRWVLHRAPHQGALWYNGLIEKIESLRHHPERCPVAPEAKELRHSVRQLLYGKRPYRILFLIVKKEVHILHIRRGARSPWNLEL